MRVHRCEDDNLQYINDSTSIQPTELWILSRIEEGKPIMLQPLVENLPINPRAAEAGQVIPSVRNFRESIAI